MPRDEILSHWYREKYRQEYKRSDRPGRRHILRAARLARERYMWMVEALARAGRSRGWLLRDALDVGCSGGEFLHLLQCLGVAGTGIEPHQGYAAHAKELLGLEVHCGTLGERAALLGDRRFDLITLFHVLEHMTHPRETLGLLRDLLRDDGLLFIEVPDAAGRSAPNNMFFRAHTLYFAHTSLVSLVQSAGFAVVADNFEKSGNLRVVLRKSAAVAFPWAFDGYLLRAQSRRGWLPYLWGSLLGGRLGRRLAARLEENRSAGRYPTDIALLRDVHRGLARLVVSDPDSSGTTRS